jgi:hypothetical protein
MTWSPTETRALPESRRRGAPDEREPSNGNGTAAAISIGRKLQAAAGRRQTRDGTRFVRVGGAVPHRGSDFDAWLESRVRSSASDRCDSA